MSQESKLIERPPLDVAIQGAPRSMSRTVMRLSLPSVVVTLLYSLKREGMKRGIETLCLGGGNGVAMAVELVN